MMKRAILILAILFYISINAQSAAQFPNSVAIVNHFKGKDAVDGYLKQAAAIYHMQQVVNVIDGKRSNVLSNQEREINTAYQKAYDLLIAKANIPKQTGYAPDPKKKLLDYYEASAELQQQVLAAFFDLKTQEQLKKALAESLILGNDNEMNMDQAKEKADAEEEAMMKATGNQEEGIKGWITSLKNMSRLPYNHLFWGVIIIILFAFLWFRSKSKEEKQGCLPATIFFIIGYVIINWCLGWDWPFAAFFLSGLLTLLFGSLR